MFRTAAKKDGTKIGQKNSVCSGPMQNGVPPRNLSVPIFLSKFLADGMILRQNGKKIWWQKMDPREYVIRYFEPRFFCPFIFLPYSWLSA